MFGIRAYNTIYKKLSSIRTSDWINKFYYRLDTIPGFYKITHNQISIWCTTTKTSLWFSNTIYKKLSSIRTQDNIFNPSMIWLIYIDNRASQPSSHIGKYHILQYKYLGWVSKKPEYCFVASRNQLPHWNFRGESQEGLVSYISHHSTMGGCHDNKPTQSGFWPNRLHFWILRSRWVRSLHWLATATAHLL